MPSPQSFANTPKPVRSVPAYTVFFVIALTLVVGFIAGTRSQDLLAIIGTPLGLKVATGSLDTTELQKTYRALAANYDGTLDSAALIQGASKGMVAAAGDKYTVYFTASEAAEFQKELSGDIGGGIGAEIGLRNGKPTIIRVLDNNPAQAAGVEAGDTIVGINDAATTNWTADDTASKVRGDVGTTVKITVMRGNQTKDFTITRAAVNNPSVQSRVDDGIGILTITRFDDNTGGLARKAAESFKAEGVKGVILDLRGNGGGALPAAPAVASLWLDDKIVVSERTNGKVTDELKSESDPILNGIPTVVLVDAGTASASEIVAGALHDYKTATLIGEKTYGKGTVQKLLGLDADTLLKVTVARWYTPNGKNITKEGIMPDQTVELKQADIDAGSDPQLVAAKKQLGA